MILDRLVSTPLPVTALAVAGILALPAPASAEVFVGGAEVDEVYEIEGGGAVSGMVPFATGVTSTRALCVGPGGELYAAQNDSVVIITGGGDFSGAEPFATGLVDITAMSCTQDEVLVVRFTYGVIDITAGGSFGGAPTVASHAQPLAVLRDGDGTLWLSGGNSIYDATAGGDFTGAPAWATASLAVYGLTQRGDGTLLATDFSLDRVMDFTGGGDLTVAPPFATGHPFHAISAGATSVFAQAAFSEDIYDVSAGGDVSGDAPFAVGPDATLSLLALLALDHECGNGYVQQDEECDDWNTEDGDGCSSTCTVETGGDTTGGETGGDESTDEGATAAETSAGGGTDTGGPSPDPSSSGATDEGSSEGSGSSGSGADGDGSGCACRSAAPQSAPVELMLLGLLFGASARRRGGPRRRRASARRPAAGGLRLRNGR